MIRLSLVTSFFVLLLFGCNNGIDKSLIGNSEQLKSPFSNLILYRYNIESSMAFGSGFTVIKILPTDKECDYTDRDFFRFSNDSPFWIKWKNKDTLSVKCLIVGGGLADKQPIKKELLKWKDWTFEVEYYSLYSTGSETKYFFDSYTIDTNSIIFKSKGGLQSFNQDEVQLSLDTNHIYITQFKIDTFNSKLGISLSKYDINIKEDNKKREFLQHQAFVKTKP